MNKIFTIRMPEDADIFYRTFRYPAGEVQTRLNDVGIGRVLQAEEYEIILHAVPDVMRLAQLVDAIKNVKDVPVRRLFLQYMPYSRADRRFTPGDSAGLDIFLRHIALMDFTSVWTFDVHNEKATDEIAKKYGITLANMKPTDDPVDQIEKCIRRMIRQSDNPMLHIALISPDEGARTRYNLDKYGLDVIVGGKKRDAETGKLLGFHIDDNIKDYDAALIVDDICDGGGTFIGLGGEIMKVAPGLLLGLYVSHGIFSKGLEPLDAVFDWVFTSDYTYHKREEILGAKI
jgi:ribose-phosphate pyrophosphokinase